METKNLTTANAQGAESSGKDFEVNYSNAVNRVVDLIEKEMEKNECFHWTSEVQGATDIDLFVDVILEYRRRLQKSSCETDVLGDSVYFAELVQQELERKCKSRSTQEEVCTAQQLTSEDILNLFK